jgi:hypothetical protein
MRKILISTNMYKGSEFGQVLPYLKRFPGQVGVEVFPMFHEECFEKNLRHAALKGSPGQFPWSILSGRAFGSGGDCRVCAHDGAA